MGMTGAKWRRERLQRRLKYDRAAKNLKTLLARIYGPEPKPLRSRPCVPWGTGLLFKK